MQIATPLYPPLSRGQACTPQNLASSNMKTSTTLARLGMQIAFGRVRRKTSPAILWHNLCLFLPSKIFSDS